MNYWDLKAEAEFEFAAIVAISISLWLGFWIGESQKKKRRMEKNNGPEKPDRRSPPV